MGHFCRLQSATAQSSHISSPKITCSLTSFQCRPSLGPTRYDIKMGALELCRDLQVVYPVRSQCLACLSISTRRFSNLRTNYNIKWVIELDLAHPARSTATFARSKRQLLDRIVANPSYLPHRMRPLECRLGRLQQDRFDIFTK